MTKKKLSTSKVLAFASADLFGGGSFNIVNFLYPGFLALTVGIPVYWVGVITLTARIWDAITDPIMGIISDRTNTKLGKRRIYLIVASPLVVLGLFLLFYPFSFASLALRIVASLFTYLFFTTVQTMVMIPYYSLSSEISSDYQERARANTYRLGFSIFSSILCVALPGMIVDMFKAEDGSKAPGFIIMSLIFGIIFGVSVLLTGLFAKEEIITAPIKTKITFKNFIQPLKLKTYRQYLWIFITVQITMAVMSGLFFFYIDFYICRDLTQSGVSNHVGLIGAALMFFMQIVALPIYLSLIKKKDKMYVYRLGSYIWILSALLLFILPPNANEIIVYLVAVVIGFGISGPGLIPHTIFGDVVDSSELVFKERKEGTISGLTNFANKTAQAIGLSLAMMLIGAFGFIEAEIGTVVYEQPLSAQMALKAIISFAPLIFVTIGVIISKKYKINYAMQQRIVKALEERASGYEAIKLVEEIQNA